MLELILHGTVVLGAAFAAGLAVRSSADLLAAFVWRVLPARRSWLERRLALGRTRPAAKTEPAAPSGGTLPSATPSRWRAPAVVAAALLGLAALRAAFGGSLPLALFFLALAAGSRHYLSTAAASRATAHPQLAGAVAALVEGFRSAYLVHPTVYEALEQTQGRMKHPPLVAALAKTLAALRLGREQAAFAGLDELGDAYLRQFVFLLERVADSDPRALHAALEDLTRRLAERQRLMGRLRVAMASVNGTVRFLEAANLAAALVVLIAPFWWSYYADRPLPFIAGVLSALAAAAYFDQKVASLAERIL